jgi:hypothetical protein
MHVLFAFVLLGFNLFLPIPISYRSTFPTSLLVFRLLVWQVAPVYEDDGREEWSQI